MDRRVGADGRSEGAGSAIRIGLLGLLALVLGSCASTSGINKTEFAALENALERHITVLASDEFGGRRPATEGETRTLAYVRGQLEDIGLESGTNDPANPWLAPVPLLRTASLTDQVEFTTGEERIAFSTAEAFASTNLRRTLLEFAPLLFAGSVPAEPAQNAFVGQVVVLFGTNSEAIQQREAAFDAGAAAVLQLVDDPAIVENARAARQKERFLLDSGSRDELTVFMAEDAFARAIGEELWETLSKAVQSDGFVPRELPISARIEATSQARPVTSHNLIARIPGLRPDAGAIVLMGHWDHFGTCGEPDEPEKICNGAVDNASGIASMIELSRRLMAQGPYDRDIYFLATSAEEWGLLGAKSFLVAPPLPVDTIVAVFNFDSVAIAPRGTPVAFVGQGQTPLDTPVLAAIERSGRDLGSQILADRFLRRQDSWAFLEQGVPAVAITSALGDETRLERFLATRYHSERDNVDTLELGGAVEDLLLHEDLVRELANTELYPN